MAGAPVEARPAMVGSIKTISTISRIALGLLIVTGVTLVFTKYNGDFAGLGTWFWIKMVLVAALLGGVIYAGMLFERASKGDAAAAQRQRPVGMTMTLIMIAIVLAAVLTFH